MSEALPPPPAGRSEAPRRSRRPLVVGVVLGVVLPLLSFVATFAGPGDFRVGNATWAGTAFLGVLLLAFERTRSYGLGILLGFCWLVVVGAGVCTTVLEGAGG
jgi:hypothetical protein